MMASYMHQSPQVISINCAMNWHGSAPSHVYVRQPLTNIIAVTYKRHHKNKSNRALVILCR